MLFGTYHEDEAYLWKKFRSPEFDPATGIDRETAGEKLAAFADMEASPPVVKARAFEFLAKNLRIEVDPHDFFPAFGCWKRRPCPMTSLLKQLNRKVALQKREQWELLRNSGACNIWIDFDHSVPEWDEIVKRGFPGLLANAMA